MKHFAVVLGLIFGTVAGYGLAAVAARNSGGTYTRPTGNPVVSGTTISATWANTLTSDIATEITDSLSRSGKGGMLAPFRVPDGTTAAPSLSFTSEVVSGLYRPNAGTLAMSVNGADVQRWASGSTTFPGAVAVSGSLTVTGASSTFTGATSFSGPTQLSGTTTISSAVVPVLQATTASLIFATVTGSLTVAAGSASIPLNWSGITGNSNWTATNTPAYAKDSFGIVHLKGGFVVSTGAQSPAFTLPAGYRPLSQRIIPVVRDSGSGFDAWVANPDGSFVANYFVNGTVIYLDGVTFLAEQ